MAIREALKECLVDHAIPGVAEAFRFTRALQGILLSLREKIASEYESILRKETTRYGQALDDSSWLEERTAQIKALVEAGAVGERERILQIVFDAIGAALRAQHGMTAENPVVDALARKIPTGDLLRRIDVLESLRYRLALGVQESLALESGFLEMINESGVESDRLNAKEVLSAPRSSSNER